MTRRPAFWIAVPGWRKFQHYKDRNPRWIKVYLDLLDRPEWENLTYAERGLLVTIWLHYGRRNGPVSSSVVRTKSASRHFSSHIQALSQSGFIEARSASGPLAPENRERREEGSASAENLRTVDEAMLELARGWLENHDGPTVA